MASFTASVATSSITNAVVSRNRFLPISASPIVGLPTMGKKGMEVKCSMDETKTKEMKNETTGKTGMNASLLAAVCAATMSSPPAMALVDERLSTEGTGLPFGLSNNLLGWILFGVFGLIWALYFTYTSSLEEDEESGMSL